MQAKSQVGRFPVADSASAVAHFEGKLRYETDCWDVRHAIVNGIDNFILIDTRSEELFTTGHVRTAVHLPHGKINRDTLPSLADGAIFVVYCAGPHCNGSTKAALKIASLGFPVKEMIGGVEGWKDDGARFATIIRGGIFDEETVSPDAQRRNFRESGVTFR